MPFPVLFRTNGPNDPALTRSKALLASALLMLGGCGGEAPARQDAGGGASEENRVTVLVLGTTDVHGWLLPVDDMTGEPTDRGLALLAPLVDSVRAANPGRVVLVDSGDLLQGSPMAAAFTPLGPGEVHPVVLAMNHLAYDAAALGNHEFNFGIDHLEQVVADARFPFLAANVRNAETGIAPWPTRHQVVLEVEGEAPIRVGITSALPPGVAVWDRDHVEGRLVFPPMLDALREEVPLLRAEGADLVVVAAHSGLEGTSYDMEATGLGPENQMAEVAREVPGIDGIFLGHTHREVGDTLVHGVRVAQAGPHGRSLAVIEFDLVRDQDAGRWVPVESRGHLLRPDPTRIDPVLAAALAPARERTQAEVQRVIARSPSPLPATEARVQDTPLLRWISDVQREVTGADLSAVAAFSLGDGLPEGEIRVAHLARLYPYDNNLLRAVEIRGDELRAYLEFSARYFLPCPDGICDRIVDPSWPGFNFDMIHGVTYTLDLTRPVGERVVRLERDGVPVREDQVFTLALNNYRHGGGGGFPAVASAPVRFGSEDPGGRESVRDLLIRDLERRGSPPDFSDFQPGWEIIPEALRQQALREMSTARR